jgi:anaerobic magnesium-protoporphyrin IX monomethyl ester cyclase
MSEKREKVVLTTIATQAKYVQLGLYNLKAYWIKSSRSPSLIDIDIDVIYSEKFYSIPGSVYPYLDSHALFYHAMKIIEKKPRVIGLSCYMWNIESTIQLIRVIKKINSKISIVLGGPEASSDPVLLMKKEKLIDVIVRDEGEATFSELLNYFYHKKGNIKKIKGISYRSGKRIYHNQARPPLDVNELPSPYLCGLIDMKEKDICYSIETSRGCPFTCAYCTYSIGQNHILRFFPISRVNEEIAYVLKNRVKRLWIVDDNFNINPPRAKKILEEAKKYRVNTSIQLFINASMWVIDDDFITLLKENNTVSLVGVQITNSKVLSIIKRKNILSSLEKNLVRFDQNKIKYKLQFILGLPGSTYEDFKNSLNWAFRFDSLAIDFFPLLVLQGTQIYKEAKRLGIQYHSQPSYMVKETKQMKEKEINDSLNMIIALKILYNYHFYKDTLNYLTKHSSVQFTDVLSEWVKKYQFKIDMSLNPSKYQKLFTDYLIKKYAIQVNMKELANAFKNDNKDYKKFLVEDVTIDKRKYSH